MDLGAFISDSKHSSFVFVVFFASVTTNRTRNRDKIYAKLFFYLAKLSLAFFLSRFLIVFFFRCSLFFEFNIRICFVHVPRTVFTSDKRPFRFATKLDK